MREQGEDRPLVVPRLVVGVIEGVVRMAIRLAIGAVRAVWAVLPKWLKAGFIGVAVLGGCWLGVNQPWRGWFY